MRKELEQEDVIKERSKFILFTKLLLVIIFVVGLFILAFSQILFKNESIKQIEAKKKYNFTEQQTNDAIDDLKKVVNCFHNKAISLSFYKEEIDRINYLIQCKEIELEVSESQLKRLNEKHKIFGFSSTRIFFAHLAMPSISFFLGLFLMILYFKEKDYFFRKVILLFSFCGAITGGFYIIWVFFPKPDIPESVYILMLLTFALIGSIGSFVIGRYIYSLSQINLKIKLQDLVKFITHDIRKKYIKEEDRQEFIKDYLGKIEKLSKK